MSDIQTSDWSETDSSNNAAVPNGWPEGMAPSGVNNAARAVMGAIRREWDRSHPTVTNGGTTTVLTLTYSVAPPAYAAGMIFWFKAAAAIGATPTINVSALGAKKIYKNVAGVATQIAANDWYADQIIGIAYDTALDGGSGGFWWINQFPQNAALTNAANTFTAAQAITGSSTAPLVLTSTGTSIGLALKQLAAVPVAGQTADYSVNFNNLTPAEKQAVLWRAINIDPTAGSEDSAATIFTLLAGTLAERFRVAGGLVVGNAAFNAAGDKGAGTINASTAYYLNGSIINAPILVQYRETSGTNIETYAASGWRTVNLNSEQLDPSSIASLASKQVTLPAGTYNCSAALTIFTASGGAKARIRLRDVTNGTTLYATPNAGAPQLAGGLCSGAGAFTIAGSVAIELQVYAGVNLTAGGALSTGEDEVYGEVSFLKVA